MNASNFKPITEPHTRLYLQATHNNQLASHARKKILPKKTSKHSACNCLWLLSWERFLNFAHCAFTRNADKKKQNTTTTTLNLNLPQAHKEKQQRESESNGSDAGTQAHFFRKAFKSHWSFSRSNFSWQQQTNGYVSNERLLGVLISRPNCGCKICP